MAPVTLLTTRFNCFCTTTGQAIPPGSRVAYDSELSQFHTLMKLDNNIEENYYQASSEVFKYIEKAFIHWYKEQSVYNPEVKEYYNDFWGGDQRGALIQAIDNAVDIAHQRPGHWVYLHECDLEAAFQV